MLGVSPAGFFAARAGSARLPRKKWRRERVMGVNSQYMTGRRKPVLPLLGIVGGTDESSEFADNSADLLRAAAGGGAGPGECRVSSRKHPDHQRMALAGDLSFGR